MAMMRAGDALRRMAQLPFAALDAIVPGTALILAPHPDDESLGCGGLIAACCDRGRPPLVVVVTDGSQSHPDSALYPPSRLAELRECEALAATSRLGLAPGRVRFLRLPDAAAPTQGVEFDAAVAEIAALVRVQAATTICASWEHDPHCDHAAAARMGAAAARQAGAALLRYPVWGWLLPEDDVLPSEDIVGLRLDITPYLPRKRRAIAAHASQYAGLIPDDAGGFRLPGELLAACDRPFEVYLRQP